MRLHRAKNRHDLENELFGGSDLSSQSGWSVRDNEGEAAEHGIYFDDTAYDYMQHMRDMGGNAAGETVWVEAPAAAEKEKDKDKGKQKQSLEDALDLEHEKSKQEARGKLTDPSILPSRELRRQTYQDQQDVPDALAGFQPDMDPRLREVLEALEDEAYVDAEETDDFFTSIADDKREVSLEEFEDQLYYEDGEEDDGWESDRTARPGDGDGDEDNTSISPTPEPTADPPSSLAPPTPHIASPSDINTDSTNTNTPVDPAQEDGAFMSTFRSLPSSLKKPQSQPQPNKNQPGTSSLLTAAAASTSTTPSSLFPPGAKRKKRKGALTASTGYSMSSSSIYRSEGLRTLDARFEKVMESYENDDDDDDDDDDEEGGVWVDVCSSLASGVSGVSGPRSLSGRSGASARTWRTTTTSRRSSGQSLAERKDVDAVMDEFLGGYRVVGGGGGKKGRGKKGVQSAGLRELDEIRRELGPARVRA